MNSCKIGLGTAKGATEQPTGFLYPFECVCIENHCMKVSVVYNRGCFV